MMLGVGLDLCAIHRIEEMLRNPRFLERFFDSRERAYIDSQGPGRAASAAACFAAKEAFCKALGTGFDGIAPMDVVLLHQEGGAPCYELRGLALERAQQLGVRHTHLSLSHDGGVAAAVCILEG